ncbi:MAG: hypothetical protein JSR33_13660 [Proteobacteria bacterium]|nr:hypothetical protein [Pseudomonadota bacterium]
MYGFAGAVEPSANFNFTNYQGRVIQVQGTITYYLNTVSQPKCTSKSVDSGIIIINANSTPVRFSSRIPDDVVTCLLHQASYRFWIDISIINGRKVQKCSSSIANLMLVGGYIKIEASNLMFKEDGSCSIY